MQVKIVLERCVIPRKPPPSSARMADSNMMLVHVAEIPRTAAHRSPFTPLPLGVINGSSSGLDTHLSTVASKLQAVSASINAGLEKSMVEVMVSVPRVVTEVERVEAAIKTLNGELMNLSGQVTSIKLARFGLNAVALSRRLRFCTRVTACMPVCIVGTQFSAATFLANAPAF